MKYTIIVLIKAAKQELPRLNAYCHPLWKPEENQWVKKLLDHFLTELKSAIVKKAATSVEKAEAKILITQYQKCIKKYNKSVRYNLMKKGGQA